MNNMIKELILEANEIINKECHIVYHGTEDSCSKCNYKMRIGSKRLCVIVEELVDKYKEET